MSIQIILGTLIGIIFCTAFYFGFIRNIDRKNKTINVLTINEKILAFKYARLCVIDENILGRVGICHALYMWLKCSREDIYKDVYCSGIFDTHEDRMFFIFPELRIIKPNNVMKGVYWFRNKDERIYAIDKIITQLLQDLEKNDYGKPKR